MPTVLLPEPIKICRKALSRFFGSDIHNTLVDEKNGSYTLSKVSSVLETSDQKGFYTLWGFPVKEELQETLTTYPIYFSFRITLKANEEIADLNIKLFKEDYRSVTNSSTKPTELLLRIEWSNDLQTDNKGGIHAQPHWHIHSYTIIDKLEGRNPEFKKTFLQILDEEDQKPNPSSISEEMEEDNMVEDSIVGHPSSVKVKEIPSFKFHLAMLAEWEKREDIKHNKQLTNEYLEFWLPRCLKYIKEQIEYVLEKME